jgi:EpsI family protein
VGARAVVIAVLLVAAAVYVRAAAGAEARVDREPLETFPWQIAEWSGYPLPPFDADVLRVLGADEYLHRRYVRAGARPVDLYVGYYRRQRQGDTIHSPQNCLPGAGWQPVEAGRTLVAGARGAAFSVNRYVVQKGLERRMVFYWYQGRGRIVANEYANKAWLVLDALRARRTDGALVRLITEPFAAGEATAFASAALAPLFRVVP